MPLLIVLSGFGCGDPGGGVPDAEAVPERGATAVVRAGSVDDPATALTTFTDVVAGPAGRIYTFHRSEPHVRIHGPDGGPVGSFGRAGDGPGELSFPLSIGVLADTVWIADARKVVSYFDADGTFLDSERLLLAGDLASLYVLGRLPDGSFTAERSVGLGEMTGPDTVRRPVVRLADRPDGTGAGGLSIVDTLHVRRMLRPTVILEFEGGGFRAFPQPWDASPILEPSDDHATIWEVERPVAGSREAGSFTIVAISTKGPPDTALTRSISYRPVPLPAARFEHVLDSLAAEHSDALGQTEAATAALIEEALTRPAYLPPVVALVPGAARVWLRLASPPGADAAGWLVLSSDDGAPLFRTTLPLGFDGMAVVGDTIWGLESDDLDVPYLVAYEARSG